MDTHSHYIASLWEMRKERLLCSIANGLQINGRKKDFLYWGTLIKTSRFKECTEIFTLIIYQLQCLHITTIHEVGCSCPLWCTLCEFKILFSTYLSTCATVIVTMILQEHPAKPPDLCPPCLDKLDIPAFTSDLQTFKSGKYGSIHRLQKNG